MGLRLSMTNFQFARRGRRALLAGFTAFAAASSAMTPLALRAEEGLGGQAEWRQSYETSESISVSRESTPVLSSATVAATDADGVASMRPPSRQAAE